MKTLLELRNHGGTDVTRECVRDGKIITVSAYITEPAGTVTLSVFQTLGYEVTDVNALEKCHALL